jgi:hypothetical protein
MQEHDVRGPVAVERGVEGDHLCVGHRREEVLRRLGVTDRPRLGVMLEPGELQRLRPAAVAVHEYLIVRRQQLLQQPVVSVQVAVSRDELLLGLGVLVARYGCGATLMRDALQGVSDERVGEVVARVIAAQDAQPHRALVRWA